MKLIRYICARRSLVNYPLRRSLFQRFFCLDAEALFPKMKEDVCLSAPVVLERTAGPLKTRAHKPQRPITRSTRKNRDTRGLVDLEFQAKKAEMMAAADRGASRGWLGLNSAGIGGGVEDGMLTTRVLAMAIKKMARCWARKLSRSVEKEQRAKQTARTVKRAAAVDDQ